MPKSPPWESIASVGVLRNAVASLARLLPAQGPIGVFIHHNPLHAFEDQPFEKAVAEAAARFGCEAFLAEDRYRSELRSGRIALRDLEASLRTDLGPRADDHVLGQISRYELRRRVLIHGIPAASGVPLQWLLSETQVLQRFREDLPGDAREALIAGLGTRGKADRESIRVGELWQSCLDAVVRASYPRPPEPISPTRHRDLLLATCNIDIDDRIHPVLIRFVSAYLDQGLAHWPMPRRELGMYECFLDLHGHPLSRLSGAWSRALRRMIDDDRSQTRDAWASLQHSLGELGVEESEWEVFLVEEALSLPGWAGMVRQIEERPDRVPVIAVPARLVDFLAIRMLLTRAVLSGAAQKHRLARGSLDELRLRLRSEISLAPGPSLEDRAWTIFHVAQLSGFDAAAIERLAEVDIADLEAELLTFDSVARRCIFHLSFERNLRHRYFDAIVQHVPVTASKAPHFQAIFCIDEREESFRRHLEEVDAGVETFGAAGFFGVAMYFRGATDAHPRPLCPVSVQPQHYVDEVSEPRRGAMSRWRPLQQRMTALVDKNIHIGSRTFARGAVIMATIGVLWVVPLVLRVLFPWFRRSSPGRTQGPTNQASRLCLDRTPDTPRVGRHAGFTIEEMADIVRGQLAPLGIVDRLAPLVFVLGHGSTSLNNPQESAHDCGACGGGRGGPNAQALAQMANDPRVRARLSQLEVNISSDTWFVGGQRNTANNDVAFFDEHLVPKALGPQLERAKASFEAARLREAHERCRRFATASTRLTQEAALFHVQTRAADLAQPRPEYGHASNAVCFVGRRSRTRGLFLDRRAFLASYDPSCDPEGELLARLLAGLVPVVAGINLEYFFGYIDPTGYGCGTKLPHNVTGLLGVMDGAQSDLRTGLPWQMLEIHEPVRLTLVVETRPQLLLGIVEKDAPLRRLIEGRWIFLATLDPESNKLHELGLDGARPYGQERPLNTVAAPSLTHYRGKRGHLPFVSIEPAGMQRVS